MRGRRGMIDDRTNRDFLFATRSRTKRAMMIVHRTPSTSSSSEEEEQQQQQQQLIHTAAGRRNSNDNSNIRNGGGYKGSSSSNNANNGKSRAVHMFGFFGIAAACLILSLGFFSSKETSGGVHHNHHSAGGGAAAVAIDSSRHSTTIDPPQTMSNTPHTPIITTSSTTAIKHEQDNDDDNVDDSGGAGLTVEELKAIIADLAGSDQRIMRWNAQKHTAKRQRQGGCSQLRQGLDIILNPNASWTRKQLAAEFATFCITDNPTQREIFSTYSNHDADDGGMHKTVVDLVTGASSSKDDHASMIASAMAGHLIYIASFSNIKNQQTFFQQGAVEALAKVVMDKNALPVQVMWAAAALQNLAASYCDTEHNGRCYWDWNPQDDHVVVTPDSLPIVSDGTLIRQSMLQIDGLVQALTEWACTGPVHGQASATNVFPGENGQAGRDDANPNIVAWAATGALKNLALEPTAKAAIEPSMSCLCRLKNSPDWLENLKAKDALHFMRRGGHPCWFDESSSSPTTSDSNGSTTAMLCMDNNFIDAQEYSCDGYGNPQPGDCAIPDALFPNMTASQACCACGGGTKVETLDPEASRRLSRRRSSRHGRNPNDQRHERRSG